MGRPPLDASRDTRAAILSAALELFAEHGYHGAGMRALAAAAGVRESAIDHHFPSKAALFQALVADFQAARTGELEAEFGRGADRPLDELLLGLAQRLLFDLASPHYGRILRVIIASGAELADEDESIWRRITEEPRRVLVRALAPHRKAGRVRDDIDVEVFVLHFVAPLVIASNALFSGGKGALAMPVQRFVRQHVAFSLQALAPPRGRRATPAR